MSIHRHCDWCKKDMGTGRVKVTVADDRWHFCTYGHASAWFERQEVVYEVSDRDRKDSYWADQRCIENEARCEVVA